jgi:hypothetical protein
MTRLIRPSRLATAVVVTALLAGCGPIQRNTFESAPLPAINEANVATALAAVDDVRNEANPTRDPELLSTVEGDPLLTISTAIYAYEAQVDPENTHPPAPVGHVRPTTFVPRFTGYPQWFVTAAPWRDGEPGRLEIFTRDSAAGGWTSVIAPELLTGVDFPTLALDPEQYVVPLSPSDLDDLPISVAALATAHATALSTGAADGLGGKLADDPWTTTRRDADAAAAAAVGEAANVQAAYAVGVALPQALRTQDGGALVWYTVTETLTYTVAKNFFLQLDETTAKIVGVNQVTGTLVEQSAGQLAVYIPPSASGTPRVVAARWDRTGLTSTAAPPTTPPTTPPT